MATGITAEYIIQTMIQEALVAQAEVHRKESADRERLLLAGFEVRLQLEHSSSATATVRTPPASPNSSTRSTVKRTTLDMGSSVVYNGLGGTSTSAISQAAAHFLISVSVSCCGISIQQHRTTKLSNEITVLYNFPADIFVWL